MSEADEADMLAKRIVDSQYFSDLGAAIRAYGDQRARQAAEEMRTVLDDVLFWAGSTCPQHDDRTDPNPCPLCGATLESGPNDTCKAAENRVPPRLLAAIRASLPLPPDLGGRK